MSRCQLALALLLAACADTAETLEDADAHEVSLGRLLVSRTDVAELTVVDLDQGRVVGSLPFPPGARVWAGSSGRYGYALDPAGSLRVVDPGLWLLSHIDHFHVMREPIGLRAESVALAPDGVVTVHDGWVAVHDATHAAFFQERAITAGMFAPQALPVPRAGVALINQGQLLLAQGAVELRALAAPEQGLASFPCEARDAAATSTTTWFACTDGLVRHDTRFERVSTLSTHRVRSAAQAALAQAGPRAMLLARDGEAPVSIAVDDDVVDFALHRAGRVALVLTRDGVLRELSLEHGVWLRSVQVLQPDASARLALSHAYAYLADARRRDLPAVRLRSFAVEQHIPFPGAASELALVGLPPQYTDERE